MMLTFVSCVHSGAPLVPLDRELLSCLVAFARLAPVLEMKRVASSSLLSLSVGDLQVVCVCRARARVCVCVLHWCAHTLRSH
jgi:hypothetical protein